MSGDRYPEEVLSADDDGSYLNRVDDGTMPANVETLADAVVGHRIVSVEQGTVPGPYYGTTTGAIITLDNGKRVTLANTDDCCANTDLTAFLLHPESVDHIITGVGTTGEFTTWHIYADMGDVLELTVDWSPGNPFYYAYGFHITVEDGSRGVLMTDLTQRITDLLSAPMWDKDSGAAAPTLLAECVSRITELEAEVARLKLDPIESMTLTIARSQLERGVDVGLNTVAMLVMTIDRLTGVSS